MKSNQTVHPACLVRFIVQLLPLLSLCLSAYADEARSSRQFTIVAINDVYRIEGLNGSRDGGLARVRTLRRMLEQESSAVLLLHAGDFLYPSLLSDRYDGEQMIDLLNRMDGDPERFDARMLVTFGNHEFDKARLNDAERLERRIDQSQFDWLGSNITFARNRAGEPSVRSPRLRTQTIIDVGGIKVGLFSLSTGVARPAYVQAFESPAAVAAQMSRALREQGAEVVVALTHLSVTEDEAVLRAVGASGPDLVIGGHEHHRIRRCVPVGAVERCILKADADAVTATVARVELGAEGARLADARFQPLGEAVAPDPAVGRRVQWWLDRYAREYCGSERPGCLQQVIGHAALELVAEEHRIRQFETNLGDWVADRMLAGYNRQDPSGTPATVAFINSGALRYNQNIPPGPITERDLKELLPYPVDLLKMELSGRELKAVLEHAAGDWPGNGRWLQVSGITLDHRPGAPGGPIANLRFSAANGGAAIADDDRLWVVTSRFLRGNPEEERCGDGYCMLMQIPPQRVVMPQPPIRLEALLRAALKEAGPNGIAPHCEGRIRNPDNDCR